MTREEHLLTIIAEECTEIAKCATKALRFGLEDTGPENPDNNATMMSNEFCDLLAVLEMLRDESPMFRLYNARVTADLYAKLAQKKTKVEAYFEVSRKNGRLT